LGLAAVEESIPGIGQVVGGVFAAKAIAAGALGHDADLMGHMGEGSSGYEQAANDIEGVCAILDMASNLVNVLAGVVGIVAVAAAWPGPRPAGSARAAATRPRRRHRSRPRTPRRRGRPRRPRRAS